MLKNSGMVKVMLKKKQRNVFRNNDKQELSLLLEHMFPPNITRRGFLCLFSGFDKNANRKLVGALLHVFKDDKL